MRRVVKEYQAVNFNDINSIKDNSVKKLLTSTEDEPILRNFLFKND